MTNKGSFDVEDKIRNLKNILNRKKCFKLICGAGNQNLQEIEHLIALYAKAGCRFFDLAADEKVLIAAQKGLDFSIPKEEQKNYHFCISIGTKEDQHIQKAKINPDLCTKCKKCKIMCPTKAINDYLQVIKNKCIGCLKCKNVCKYDAIEIYSENKLINLAAYQLFNPSCIELHASDTDEVEADEIWDYLNKNFDGFLSLCIGRGKLSDSKILSRIEKFVNKRNPYTTIIQADGKPMSGGEDDFQTTRPAVETGALIQTLNLPFYLILSGGTNSKTVQLAKEESVNIHGIGVGSFARKIVKRYIEREDFLKNKKSFYKALTIASKIIKSFQ